MRIRIRRFVGVAFAMFCATTLLVASVFWVRSYFVADGVALWIQPCWRASLTTERGRIVITWQYYPPEYPATHGISWSMEQNQPSLYGPPWRIWNFGFGVMRPNADVEQTDLFIPFWFVCVLLAAAPAVPVRGLHRLKERGRDVCKFCGYDLRASPTKCPECGAPSNRSLQPRNERKNAPTRRHTL